MAVRKVEIHVSVMDEEASKRLDDLYAKLEKLTKDTWKIKLKVEGLDEAKAQIDGFIRDASSKTIEPTVKPKFDENAFRKVMEQTDSMIARSARSSVAAQALHGRADSLFNRLYNDAVAGRLSPGYNPRGRRGQPPPPVDPSAGYFRHFLVSLISTSGWSSLIGRGGPPAGGAGGAAGGGFTWGGLFGSPVGASLIGGLLSPVAALLDSLIGFGTGSAVGAGGVGITAMFKPADLAPGLTNIKKTLSTVAQSIAPSIGMMFASFGKFAQGMAPGLAKLFGASLPFIQAWFKIAEMGAKTILPALTQVMKQFVSSGAMPAMTQGFIILMKGIAGFLVALGPGFKAGALTFRAIAMGISGILVGLGKALGWLGAAAGIMYHAIHDWWDKLRNHTAVIFDGIRHDTAHIWDMVWNNVVGRTIRGYQDVATNLHIFRHAASNEFDGLRHDIAHWWDMAWQATVSATVTGYHNVISWFSKLPGQIYGALKGLGTGLFNLGKTALNDMLAGLKAVGSTILGWIKNFFTGIPHVIMSFLHMSPPHPGSAFYDLGANFMHHVQAGMQSRAANVAGAAHGIAGSTAAAYARNLANKIGWGGQWGFINDVAMRESGWSMTARNPSSGAYGIAQFINGPSEYYQYGGNPNSISGQVIAFFNYIRQRYGSPANAWAHELNFGWYDSGGKLPPGLSLALNTTGHDEIHTSGPGGGDTYNIFVLDEGYSDAQALRLIQKVKRYKTRHGNKSTGIG